MITALLFYSLIVFFLYHVVAESDVMAKPRGWVKQVFPSWMTYPLDCVFCWSWWVGILIMVETGLTTGLWFIDAATLFAAPVVNLFLGASIRALRRAGDTTPRHVTIARSYPSPSSSTPQPPIL